MRNEFSLMNPSIRDVENRQSRSHGLRIIWGVVIAIVLSLIGLSWYGYSYINGNINGNGALLAQIPGLQKVTSAVDDRLNSVDGKLNEWGMDRVTLANRIGKLEKLEKTAASNLSSARAQAQSLANEVAQRVRREMAEDLQRLQARLGNVESVQRETQDHVSQLQAELGNMRQEMASMQQQNADRLAELQQSTQADMSWMNSQVAAMKSQVITHGAKLQSLSNEVDRERTPFELRNGQTQNISSGIYLTVSHTDVAHQKVDGWMQLADEGRIVWIRALPAQEAVTFVTRNDNRTHELVFTTIQPNGVSGYVLLPASNSPSSVVTSN